MFGSALKIIIRTLYKEKLYALLNITGLALAIAACLILGLYLHSELTYDQHHVNHKKIYRLVNEFTTENSVEALATSSRIIGKMLVEEYPEVEDSVRFLINSNEEVILRYEDQAHIWTNLYFTSNNLFNVFTHEILYGDPETALTEPYTAAISETVARTYFGDENPIGKSLVTERGQPNKIVLVFKDLPANTHLRYDVLFSDENEFIRDPDNLAQRRQQLFNIGAYTYLLMREDYNLEDFRQVSEAFYERHMAAQGKDLKMSWRSWLQPLQDIHLYSDLGRDLPTGNRFYVYAFTAVAFFIILVACINYVNLSTARSAKRAREVGMRKILGIKKTSLVFQFLSESIIYSLIALVVGMLLVELLLSQTSINELLGKPLSLSLSDRPEFILWAFILTLIIGIVSGLYPAFYLSSAKPMYALSRGKYASKANIRLRELLVLLQFTMSVGVIACTLLMYIQMQYISNKALGFNKENRIMIMLRGADLIEKVPVIKTELMKNSNILGVSSSDNIMGQTLPLGATEVEMEDGNMETVSYSAMQVADDFLKVMGMELAEGRDFSQKLLTDIGASVIVNEALVKKMGWEKPLGKTFGSGRVIGVATDFHFKSLHNPIEPMAIFQVSPNFDDIQPIFRPFIQRLLIVNISGKDIYKTLSFLESKFSELDPRNPFDFEFIDESLEELYQSETRLMKLIGIFAGICIFIACLGLFGLSAFTTEQKTKEIGIRKVLGATTSQIILMLSRSILVLILISAVIASVFTYLAVEEWLSGFAYKADTNYLVFLIATGLSMLVAYLTVALQSYKTAQADPIRALRYE